MQSSDGEQSTFDPNEAGIIVFRLDFLANPAVDCVEGSLAVDVAILLGTGPAAGLLVDRLDLDDRDVVARFHFVQISDLNV